MDPLSSVAELKSYLAAAKPDVIAADEDVWPRVLEGLDETAHVVGKIVFLAKRETRHHNPLNVFSLSCFIHGPLTVCRNTLLISSSVRRMALYSPRKFFRRIIAFKPLSSSLLRACPVVCNCRTTTLSR